MKGAEDLVEGVPRTRADALGAGLRLAVQAGGRQLIPFMPGQECLKEQQLGQLERLVLAPGHFLAGGRTIAKGFPVSAPVGDGAATGAS